MVATKLNWSYLGLRHGMDGFCVEELGQAHVYVERNYVRRLYGGRPKILFPLRFNFLRSLRVVLFSSNLVGHGAVSRGGVRDFLRC